MTETPPVPWIDPAEQLAAIGQAVITTDPMGVVVYWNAAARDDNGCACGNVGQAFVERDPQGLNGDGTFGSPFVSQVTHSLSRMTKAESTAEALRGSSVAASGAEPEGRASISVDVRPTGYTLVVTLVAAPI